VTVALRKLNQSTNQDWQLRCTDTDLPTYAELEGFLTNRCIALESTEGLSVSSERDGDSHSAKDLKMKKSYLGHNSKKGLFITSERQIKCPCYSDEHKLYACNKFKELSIGDRVIFARDSRLCFICLNPNHMATMCRSTYSCRICKRSHNTLLHFKKSTGSTERVEGQAQ